MIWTKETKYFRLFSKFICINFLQLCGLVVKDRCNEYIADVLFIVFSWRAVFCNPCFLAAKII
ncbi:hypothetical protein Chls_363 [Chlamydia suis]|uniref:Uncharacterized protein n=1 Tax=Chlamydia suis TaxID=83559 RepID=A0ABX6IQ59_9CHLA|nr:hypothetical protein Chls_363 [Chlamydia suis]